MIVNQVDNTKFGDLARYQVIFRLNYTELNEETNKFDKKDRFEIVRVYTKQEALAIAKKARKRDFKIKGTCVEDFNTGELIYEQGDYIKI